MRSTLVGLALGAAVVMSWDFAEAVIHDSVVTKCSFEEPFLNLSNLAKTLLEKLLPKGGPLTF